MSEYRVRVRSIILAVTGLLVAILALRVTLDLIKADEDNFFVSLLHSLSDPLIDPFLGIVDLPSSSGISDLNGDAIVAMFVFAILGITISEIVTSFMYDALDDILINLIDAIFKVVEFTILLRIVFFFFHVEAEDGIGSFVNTVNNLTDWTQFVGLRPNILPDYLDWSAIIVLVIVVFIDLVTENFLRGVLKAAAANYKKIVVKRTAAPKPVAPVPNIVVNVPAPIVTAPAQPSNVQVTNYIPQPNPAGSAPHYPQGPVI